MGGQITDKKLNSNNTSGFCGVTRQNGKWRAFLVLKGRFYSLGTHDDLEKAIMARLDAEDRIIKPFLEKYDGEQFKRRGRRKKQNDDGKSIFEVYGACHPRAQHETVS